MDIRYHVNLEASFIAVDTPAYIWSVFTDIQNELDGDFSFRFNRIISDEENVRLKLKTDAIKIGEEQAKVMATAAHAQLGSIVAIDVDVNQIGFNLYQW